MRFAQLLFSEPVRRVQERYGSRETARRMEESPDERATLTERERPFLQERDGFYMATVGANGWPYVQFRGGPPGFVKVLDEKTLGYADFRGNRQYISMGNLEGDDRVALFFMDYPNRRRLKILARARVVAAGADVDLAARLEVPDYRARVERAVLFTVEGLDWNCPQHIPQRFTEDEWRARGPSS